MRKTAKVNEKAYKVHSLERGLDILEVLALGRSEKSLKEISHEVYFNPSTTHRILGALKSRGYIEQNPVDSKYRLSFKLFELGSVVIRQLNLREAALPTLKDLAITTGESAHLNIIDKDECLCIEKVEGHHDMKVLFLQVGGRIPLYLGAGPKVLFAYLPDEEIERILSDYKRPALTPFTITESDAIRREIKTIRSRGYSLSFGEKTVGAASIGFPVRDWRGEVVAGINISGFRERFIGDKLSVLIKQVSEAAYEISRRLHFSGSYVNPSIEPLEGPVIHHALGREKET